MPVDVFTIMHVFAVDEIGIQFKLDAFPSTLMYYDVWRYVDFSISSHGTE